MYTLWNVKECIKKYTRYQSTIHEQKGESDGKPECLDFSNQSISRNIVSKTTSMFELNAFAGENSKANFRFEYENHKYIRVLWSVQPNWWLHKRSMGSLPSKWNDSG